MGTNDLYKALPPRNRLSDLVVEHIIELIASGKLLPGEKLPSERDLAENFNVSRTVIREAIRSLIASGLVEVRTGSGAVISIPDTSVVSKSISLLIQLKGSGSFHEKTFEVRKLLEVEIAGLAAQRATEIDVSELNELCQQMDASENLEGYAKLDVAFHNRLAQATQNELYTILLDSVVYIMIEIRRMSLTIPGTMEEAQKHHKEILEKIISQDVEGARNVMADHLRIGEEHMKSLYTGWEK